MANLQGSSALFTMDTSGLGTASNTVKKYLKKKKVFHERTIHDFLTLSRENLKIEQAITDEQRNLHYLRRSGSQRSEKSLFGVILLSKPNAPISLMDFSVAYEGGASTIVFPDQPEYAEVKRLIESDLQAQIQGE
jgi:hypothetical protein